MINFDVVCDSVTDEQHAAFIEGKTTIEESVIIQELIEGDTTLSEVIDITNDGLLCSNNLIDISWDNSFLLDSSDESECLKDELVNLQNQAELPLGESILNEIVPYDDYESNNNNLTDEKFE